MRSIETARGSLGPGGDFWTAPLKLELRLEVDQRFIEPLRGVGARIGRGGSVQLRIRGSASQPELVR